jgi:hypothetical protein
MIVITNGQTINITLVSNPTTSGPVVSVNYSDTGGALPGELTQIIANNSNTVICATPAAGVSRQISSINVHNADTAPVSFVIAKTTFPLKNTTLAPGYTLTFNTDGWTVTDTNGAIQQNYNNQQSYNGWKNRLINGRFDYFQRATSLSGNGVTINQYVADKWKVQTLQNTMSCAWSPANNYVGAGYTIPSDLGPLTFNINANTAANSTSQCGLTQFVEDVTQLAGKTCTLSFYALAPSGNQTIVVEFGQYIAATGSANGTAWYNKGAYTANVVVTGNTWTRYTVTGTFPNVNANAIVSDNVAQTSSYITLWTDAGSVWANNTGVAAGFYQNTHINYGTMQLEIGNVATPVETRPPEVELALCQRYYEKSYELLSVPATVTTNAQYTFSIQGLANGTFTVVNAIPFKVTKRIDPTVTIYSPDTGNSGKVWSNPQSADVTGTLSIVCQSLLTWIATASAVAQNINMALHWTADSDF